MGILMQENCGRSEARSARILAARGARIPFLYADWAEPDHLSMSLAAADQIAAGQVILAFSNDFTEVGAVPGRGVRLLVSDMGQVSPLSVARSDAKLAGPLACAWNQLYQLLIPNGGFLLDPRLQLIEDLESQSRAMPNVEAIFLCSLALTLYVQPFSGVSLGRESMPDLLGLSLLTLSLQRETHQDSEVLSV